MSNIIPFSADQLSIVDGLRNLADSIESGETSADNLAWVIFDGDYMTTGLLEISIEPDEKAHYMHSKAMRYLEGCYD